MAWDVKFGIQSKTRYAKSVRALRHALMQSGEPYVHATISDGHQTLYARFRSVDAYLVGVRKTPGAPWRVIDKDETKHPKTAWVSGANENYNAMGADGVTITNGSVKKALAIDWDRAQWGEMKLALVALCVITAEAVRSVPVQQACEPLFDQGKAAFSSLSFSTVAFYVRNWAKATRGQKMRFGAVHAHEYPKA